MSCASPSEKTDEDRIGTTANTEADPDAGSDSPTDEDDLTADDELQTATTTDQNPGNPALTACVIVGAAGLVVIAAPELVTAPILSVLGFGSGGVGAGTLAAAVHSTIGNVVAGTLFAIAQSAVAGGVGLAVVNGMAQAGSAVMAAGDAVLGGWRPRNNKL